MKRIGIIGVGLLGSAVAGRGDEDLAAIVTTFERLAGLDRNQRIKKTD